MFNLQWIQLRPYIGRFNDLDHNLTYTPDTSPAKPSGLRAGLHAIGAHLPHKVRAQNKLNQDVLQALKLSKKNQNGAHYDAHLAWRQAIQDADAHGVSIRRALEQPAEGGTAVIEALVRMEDWRSMGELVDTPKGRYANGHVINAKGWLGAAHHDAAHGPAVKSYWRAMQGHYRNGRPHGLCTFVDGQKLLQVRYVDGVRTGDATYTSRDAFENVRIEGPWVGTGSEAMPQDALCTLLGERGSFHGTIRTERTRLYSFRFTSIALSDGIEKMLGGTELCFEGKFVVGQAFMGGSLVNARGTLTIPKATQPHAGSETVAHGLVTGSWNQNELAQGHGDITLTDGTHYVGGFGAKGRPHGTGTLTWNNGGRYEGTFADGYFQDQGTLTWSNGERIAGNFFRTPTWAQGACHNTCDVAIGDNSGVRFSLDAEGRPDRNTLICPRA